MLRKERAEKFTHFPQPPKPYSKFGQKFVEPLKKLSDAYRVVLCRIATHPPAASPRTQEADWRTKDDVDFHWGFLSPEPGVDRFGAPLSGDHNSTNASYVHDWNSSNIFPADYFSARFTGFGETLVTNSAVGGGGY